jgi:hypothetical protein
MHATSCSTAMQLYFQSTIGYLCVKTTTKLQLPNTFVVLLKNWEKRWFQENKVFIGLTSKYFGFAIL